MTPASRYWQAADRAYRAGKVSSFPTLADLAEFARQERLARPLASPLTAVACERPLLRGVSPVPPGGGLQRRQH